MDNVKKITSNIEDYLEAIFRIEDNRGIVRVKEISQVLGVTYPSTSGILKKMESMGLVEHERYGYVKLTDEGGRVARDIIRREQVLCRFFKDVLLIDDDKAVKHACRMEHFMDDSTTHRLEKLTAMLLDNQYGPFLGKFHKILEHSEAEEVLAPPVTIGAKPSDNAAVK